MFIYLCLVFFPVVLTQDITVNTTEGPIQGTRDGNYYVFYDLPYAADTSGPNRFKAPGPPPSYPGIYHAIDRGVRCAQPGQNGIVGVENCLTLSIYTHETVTAKPVFVFLNGDEYRNNHEAPYSYDKLIEEGMLVVTMNYRLSVFGFLCLGVVDAPGNAGLKDVVRGLRWIKENIAGFGGNPDNVILFGHGSAAAMVDLITLSPLANDLVHKAVTVDGSALAPWAVAYDPIGYATAFGAKLSYVDKTRDELAKLLAESSLLVLSSALGDFEFYNNTALFAPCIENPKLNPNETFLADSPINILRSGNYNHVPYISGYTDYEGTIRAREAVFGQWLLKMQENFTNFLPVDIDAKENTAEVQRQIRKFYFSDRQINMDSIEDYIAYQGDTMVLVSVVRGVVERAKTSKTDVRLFEFAFKGTTTEWIYRQIPLNGVRYGGFLNYVFNFQLGPANGDETVRDNILKRYRYFAYTGVPEFNETMAKWEPVNMKLNLTHYLFYAGGQGPVINTSVFTENGRIGPHDQRMSLWNNIYSKYYKAPVGISASGKLISSYLVVISYVVIFFYYF